MISILSREIYFLKNSKLVHWIVLSLIFVLAWIAMNNLMLFLLGVKDTIWYEVSPFSFVEIMRSRSVMLILVALIAFNSIYLPITAFFLWLNGGIKRAMAQQLLFYGFSFLFLSIFGFIHFSNLEGFDFLSYPQAVVKIFLNSSSPGSDFDHRLIKNLLGTYSLFLIVLISKSFFWKKKDKNKFPQTHFANAFEMQKAGLYSNQGIILGKAYGKTLKLPGLEDLLVIGSSGSGKTTAIAIPNLLEWRDSGVFNDLNGELYRLTAHYRKNHFNNECFLWAPADIHKNTSCYNPFFYVSDHPQSRIRDLQLIAETLIPSTKLEEKFWYQSSRQIFLTLSMYLLETKGTATLSKINDLSKQKNFFEWLKNEITTHKYLLSKALKQNALALLFLSEKIQKIILIDYHARMELFNDPLIRYATSKNDFDFRELRKKKMSIYVNIPKIDKDRISLITTLFWAQFIHVISAHKPSPHEHYRVLALMDEFDNLQCINKLKNGLIFLRNLQVHCIIFIQSLAKINLIYGHYAQNFLNSKTKIIFAINDLEDAKFFSESLNNKTTTISSSSGSIIYWDHIGFQPEITNFQLHSSITSSEIMQLADKKIIILINARNPMLANKKYWFKDIYYRHLLSKMKKIRRLGYGMGGNTITLEKD